MRLLVLGGGKFLGHAVVEAALTRGHEVTLFNRGQTAHPFGESCKTIIGDRDPGTGSGLSGLAVGTWDVVFDISGTLPRHVAQSAKLLKDRCDRYVYVSSVSAYGDLSRAGIDENAALAVLSEAGSERIDVDYGALKALSEGEVTAVYGGRSLILRPGLIIGPHDPTDRFPYWAARFGAPTMLGRGDEAVAMPNPPSRDIQCIDARDIAAWLMLVLQGPLGGVFNLVSPAGAMTMGTLAEAGHRLSVARGFDLPVRWVEEAELLQFGVVPWTGLPLWVPATEAAMAGLQQVSGTKATEAGLICRPLLSSLEDTLEWMITEPGGFAGRFNSVLERSVEAQLTGVAVP